MRVVEDPPPFAMTVEAELNHVSPPFWSAVTPGAPSEKGTGVPAVNEKDVFSAYPAPAPENPDVTASPACPPPHVPILAVTDRARVIDPVPDPTM
jgi:hypothetical protein